MFVMQKVAHAVSCCAFSELNFIGMAVNAIVNASVASLRGCVMYVTMFPCNECAKLILQARVTGIVFLSDKHHEKESWVASRRMFDLAGTLRSF